MLQQDSQNRLNANLVYNRKLSQRSFMHRIRYSQVKEKDYRKIFISIAWGVAGALAFYSAIHFGVLALFSGFNWIGLSLIGVSPAAHMATGAIILSSGFGATVFSSLSAFCFTRLNPGLKS